MLTDSQPVMEGQDPVLIPLHNESASGALPEWAMIELNGELIAPSSSNLQNDKENPDNAAAESILPKSQVELGSVRFVNDVSSKWGPCLIHSNRCRFSHFLCCWIFQQPIMILGTHELQGKVETLKHPFCVLQKESSLSNGTSYRVNGIVTRKLLFDKYPKVILR